MMPLNQYQRNAILYLLEQQETLAKPISFTPVLKMGVSEKQIRIIDYLSKTLKKAPFLTLNELQFSGASIKDIKDTIGSLQGFKESLGLAEYGFRDWLTAQKLFRNPEEYVVIPYLIYQMFYEEICEFHTVQNKLEAGLKVELDPGARYSSVRLFGASDVLLPIDDDDALMLARTLLSEHYTILEVDKSRSYLQLQKLGASTVKDVEVRCLSSSLSKRTSGGIYIYDDVQLSVRSQRNYIRYSFSNLINQHHRHWSVAA